ncbi:MAG: hypothetical protein ABR500_03035 [Dermatophilaceae bacterium]|nr:hypothetical protein [Intrasporangiaceae bacterium]
MDPLLSPEDIEAYHRDGVLVVRGVLTEDEVWVAQESIEAVLASSGPLTQVASGSERRGTSPAVLQRRRARDERVDPGRPGAAQGVP